MPKLMENAFTFVSQGMPKDTFSVVRYTGDEGLSTLYRFDILLISEKEDIDLTQVLQNPATFTIKGKFSNGPDLPFNGILSSFEQLHQAGSYIFYRAELRPKLWWLTLTHHNQVFLDKRLDQFLTAVLQDGGLSQGLDFDLRFKEKRSSCEYVCQFGESHFGFVSRWMEREGAYYWFEQSDTSEKMIASDTHIAHTALPGHETFYYSSPSGLDSSSVGQIVNTFTLKQSPLPKKVLVKDYNYMKPDLDLQSQAQVQDRGRGEIYLYGEHFPDKNEGDRLARVRAEEYRCREKIFHGMSAIPAVRPGYLFTLDRHYRREFNRSYLTVSVHHEGSQERYLISGLGIQNLADGDNLFYRNTFMCIPSDIQFRPERKAPKPQISGSLSAKIDAAGSGQYAELDEHGRYKVIMPFDLSGRSGGKASAYLRMMQPYAGPGMGFHAPLHKGTEVLLTFIEADPDRPVIAGAIPNPESPSPVNSDNQTMSVIQTGGQNKIAIEDAEGSERILMHTPKKDSFIRIGAPNDPPSNWDTWKDWKYTKPDNTAVATKDGITISTGSFYDVKCQMSNTLILGENTAAVIGDDNKFVGLIRTDTTIGPRWNFQIGPQNRANSLKVHLASTYTAIDGEKLQTAISNSRAIATVNQALGTKIEASDLVTQLVNQKAQITAGYTEAIVERTSALATKAEVTTAKTEAVAESNRVLGARINTLAEDLDFVADCTKAIGAEVKTVGSSVKTAASVLVNAASKNEITAESSELTALKSIL
ncbi:MAG: type VI secretion system Vgr family protein [Desulfatirhabdiaceae bacterium]